MARRPAGVHPREEPMRKVSFVLACFLLAAPSVVPKGATAVAAGQLPPLTTLAPGAPVQIQQDLTVNVVMIGFQEGTNAQQIDTARFRSLLPPASGAVLDGNAITGFPVFALEPYGLSFGLHYNIVHTPAAFNDGFF